MTYKRKQKIDWTFLGGILLMLLLVALFHVSVDLEKITTPPSEKWGRSIKLGETTVSSAPFLKSNKGKTDITWASADGIHQTQIDGNGKILSTKVWKPSYIDFSKLITYQQTEYTSGWLEGPTLKLTTMMSDTSPVKCVNDFFKYDIRDFKLYGKGDQLYLACISKSELGVFRIIGGNLKPISTQLMKKEITNVDINTDDKGNPLVAYGLKDGEEDYRLFVEKITEDGSVHYILENQHITVNPGAKGTRNKLINLDTLYDGKNLWLAYEVGSFRSENRNGEVLLKKILPSSRKGEKPTDFKQLLPSGLDKDEIGIRDFSFLRNTNNGNVVACYGLTIGDEKNMEIMESDLSEATQKAIPMTNNGSWNRYGAMTMTADGTGAGYLKVTGGQSFEVYYTGDYGLYKNKVNRANLVDIGTSLSSNLMYLIVASVLIVLNIPCFLGLIVLILLAQSFRGNWIDKNMDKAYLGSGVVHLLLKIFVFTHMLGNNVAKEIPSYLAGKGPFLGVVTLITVASFGLVYLHMRKTEDHSLLEDYFKAMAIDLAVSMFLVGPFVFDKI